jgi:hypothetical protein
MGDVRCFGWGGFGKQREDGGPRINNYENGKKNPRYTVR